MVNQTVNGTLETTSIDNGACNVQPIEKLDASEAETNGHSNDCHNKNDSDHVTNGIISLKNGNEISQVVKSGKSDGEYANFDPHKYAQTYYETISGGRDDWDYVPKALKFWLETFSNGNKSMCIMQACLLLICKLLDMLVCF